MSLFKDGEMRTAAKFAPKSFFRNGISSIEPETGPETVRIVDELCCGVATGKRMKPSMLFLRDMLVS